MNPEIRCDFMKQICDIEIKLFGPRNRPISLMFPDFGRFFGARGVRAEKSTNMHKNQENSPISGSEQVNLVCRKFASII